MRKGGLPDSRVLGIRNHQSIPTAGNRLEQAGTVAKQTSRFYQGRGERPDILQIICSTPGDSHHSVFVESRQKLLTSQGGSIAEWCGDEPPEFKFHFCRSLCEPGQGTETLCVSVSPYVN